MNGLRKLLCTGTAIAAMAGLMIAATPARAVHKDDFQLDGDAKNATCGGAFGTLSCDPGTAPPGTTATAVDDWDSLYDCNKSGTTLCSKLIGSAFNSADVVGDMVDE